MHLINPLWDANAGSEQRTLGLYAALRGAAKVRLWSQEETDSALAACYPVTRIRPRRLLFPKSGTFVFVGVYFPYGRWIALTLPRRIIVVYNTFQEAAFLQNRRRISAPHLPKCEIVYASELMKVSLGLPGTIEASPIDLQRFVPVHCAAREDGRFVVGRLSRDIPEKHHPADARLYERLARDGVSIQIMGGSVLMPALATTIGVTILPVGARDPVAFLHGLDCFYYRTDPGSPEPYGRVIFEAMACGLPVVCHRSGGYVDSIIHGSNGYLFDTQEEAENIIQALRADRGLSQRVGAAARRSVEAIYASYQESLRNFYLR